MTAVAPVRWRYVEPADSGIVESLVAGLDIPDGLAKLLAQRGIDSVEKAKMFLRPSLDSLSDPEAYADLSKAADLIAAAVSDGDTIVVHGDYDVDGQTATAILTRVLREAGAKVEPFVPHRVTDGYDLGPAGVKFALEKGASLIVTCDCGVTAHSAIQAAKDKGLRVVVTDHHVPGELPPADAVVNPNRPDCPGPSKELCGAGVAFKLAQALTKRLGLPDNLPFHLLDLVALATVADLVPLVGENRTLVRAGLKTIRQSRWPGVRALIEAANLNGKEIKAGHIGFILAPRLNAVGRIGDAKDGLALLLSDDWSDSVDRARVLETMNTRRQAMDQDILKQAIEQVEQSIDLDSTFGLVLSSDEWHAGVIGIVASRIVERYARPTFLIAIDGDEGKGSGRSISGFDLHEALTACGEHLLKYGGHTMAAGLSVAADKVSDFAEAFNSIALAKLSEDDLVHNQRVDLVDSIKSYDKGLEKLLQYMEPTGMGNPAPVLGVSNARMTGVRTVGQNHLKFRLEDGTGGLDAIAFGWAERFDPAWERGGVDAAFRLETNSYNGRTTLQAKIVSLIPAG
ncbi:MAG: single-stranded-DNA-specific exonuclease RecJ [Gemmatimonadota bacterium]|nr:single-stranded-DNA-specific exonuclease RecJ [Gemmatimonadota bacterium]